MECQMLTILSGINYAVILRQNAQIKIIFQWKWEENINVDVDWILLSPFVT